jgi:RNA polymerase sigma-70 factor (ECF subfamily)
VTEGSQLDRELVRRYLAHRDEESFRNLYRAHTPLLLRIALRWSDGDRGEAEDAVQDSWIRAASGLDRFRWDSSLPSWLVGIVIRCCHERRRARGVTRPESEAHSNQPSHDHQAELRLALEQVIDRLPPGYRDVLWLYDIEGFRHAEIAQQLGIDEGTSKSQLHHARVALRRAWNTPASDLR